MLCFAFTESDADVDPTEAPENNDPPKNISLLRHVKLISPAEGIRINGRPPLLDHVTVFNSSSSGVSLTGVPVGLFSARYCDFSGNQQHGIYISSRKGNVHVDITHTTLNDNFQNGVMVGSLRYGSVTLSENMFGNNLKHALAAGDVRGSLTLANSSFLQGTSKPQSSSIVYIANDNVGNVQIVNNVFMHNRMHDTSFYNPSANYAIHLTGYSGTDFNFKVSMFYINMLL